MNLFPHNYGISSYSTEDAPMLKMLQNYWNHGSHFNTISLQNCRTSVQEMNPMIAHLRKQPTGIADLQHSPEVTFAVFTSRLRDRFSEIGQTRIVIEIYFLLLILMLWHRQVIFESKGDKLSSAAECRIQTPGLRPQIASRLSAH